MLSAISAAAPERRFRWLLALSVLVATAVVLWSGEGIRFIDETDYVNLARRLYIGDGYIQEDGYITAFRPPGYPFLMVPFLALPHSVLLLKLLNVTFLAGALWLMFDLARRAQPTLAWLLGAGALAYPVWLYTASTLYPQTLVMFLLLALVWLITTPKALARTWCAAGAVLGMLILVAPSFQLLAPVIGLFVWFSGTERARFNHRGLALLTAISVLTVSPWLVRNYLVFDRFVPVATNGGGNLLMGNSEFTTPNSGIDVDVDRYMVQTLDVDEVERSRMLQRFAWEWVSEHPQQAARLYVLKVLNYFNFRAETATGANNSWAKDALMFVTYYPLLGLALWRLTWLKRRPLSRVEVLLYLVYFANAFLAAIFFTRIRFRLPFDGLLMALACISLGHWWSMRCERVARSHVKPS